MSREFCTPTDSGVGLSRDTNVATLDSSRVYEGNSFNFSSFSNTRMDATSTSDGCLNFDYSFYGNPESSTSTDTTSGATDSTINEGARPQDSTARGGGITEALGQRLDNQTQALSDLTNKALTGEPVQVDDLIRYVNQGLSKNTLKDLTEKALSGEPIKVNDLVSYVAYERGSNRAFEDLTNKALTGEPIRVNDLIKYQNMGLSEQSLKDLTDKALSGEPIRVDDLVKYVGREISTPSPQGIAPQPTPDRPDSPSTPDRNGLTDHDFGARGAFRVMELGSASMPSENTIAGAQTMIRDCLQGGHTQVSEIMRYINDMQRTRSGRRDS